MGSGADLGGRSRSRSWEEGWGEGPRRKEGRQASADLQSPFPSSHPSQHPLLWEYVRARKSKSPHSHSPLMQGFRPQASRSDKTRSHRVTSLKFLSPVLPARCGQLYWAGVHRGLGSYCTVLEKALGKGRDADSRLVPALSLPSLLSPHGSFSPNVLQRGAPSQPPRSLRFLGSLPSPKARQLPRTSQVRLTQNQ